MASLRLYNVNGELHREFPVSNLESSLFVAKMHTGKRAGLRAEIDTELAPHGILHVHHCPENERLYCTQFATFLGAENMHSVRSIEAKKIAQAARMNVAKLACAYLVVCKSDKTQDAVATLLRDYNATIHATGKLGNFDIVCFTPSGELW